MDCAIRPFHPSDLCSLHEICAPAVHLGVAKKNARAIAYYERMGFATLRELDWGRFMGMRL